MWIININPIDKGWFIWKKIIVDIIIKLYNVNWIISRNSLLKILILEINDKDLSFFLKF